MVQFFLSPSFSLFSFCHQFFFRSGKITFSWKSLATAYAIFFYIVTTVIVVIVGQERLEILRTTKQFDDKIYAIVFVIFLVPHFWVPFVGWGEWSAASRISNLYRFSVHEQTNVKGRFALVFGLCVYAQIEIIDELFLSFYLLRVFIFNFLLLFLLFVWCGGGFRCGKRSCRL